MDNLHRDSFSSDNLVNLKVLVLGAAGVGESSLMLRFTDDRSDDDEDDNEDEDNKDDDDDDDDDNDTEDKKCQVYARSPAHSWPGLQGQGTDDIYLCVTM